MDSNKKNLFLSTMLVLLAFGLTLTSCVSLGPSKAQLEAATNIQSAPNIEAVEGLENKLIWLQANAQNGGSYVIELNSDEKITETFNHEYLLIRKNNSEVTITLKGVGANRTISYAQSSFLSRCPSGSMFVVGTGTTLVLDNNITLKKEICGMTMVTVHKGGTFVMNEGSAIIGGKNRTGGGVYVGDGTFLMKGGTISGNTSYRPHFLGGGGAPRHSMYLNEKLGGGGVWVAPNGTFIKTGGTITNNSVEDIKKEFLFQYKSSAGQIDPDRREIRVPGDNIDEKGYETVSGLGSQIYFDGPNPKSIDATVGPEYSFHFSNGTFREGRNEEPNTNEGQ